MNSLQKYLTANGLFSFLSGLILIFLHKRAAQLFELENSNPFWIIGIGILFFAFTVFLEAKKQRPIYVLLIIVEDLIWVAASILLLALDPFNISVLGNLLIGAVAFIVLFFAIGQSKALAQVDRVSDHGTKRFTYERTLKAPQTSNLENYL